MNLKVACLAQFASYSIIDSVFGVSSSNENKYIKDSTPDVDARNGVNVSPNADPNMDVNNKAYDSYDIGDEDGHDSYDSYADGDGDGDGDGGSYNSYGSVGWNQVYSFQVKVES